MDYKIEELVPIVGRLAEKYTGFESTSVTYEKAEQLMEAVLYCIHETELYANNQIVLGKGIPSAQHTYEIGATYVKQKVKTALDLYNSILSDFAYYENVCLYKTFVKDIPQFFQCYDIRFEPQNTIITLDYPILKDISQYTGIDKIYEFIRCIQLEQIFLKQFPKDYIKNSLIQYHKSYKYMIENICEIIFITLIGHILSQKSLWEQGFDEVDYLKIQEIFKDQELLDIKKMLEQATITFVRQYWEDCKDLSQYLTASLDGIITRLKNAAEHGTLSRMF